MPDKLLEWQVSLYIDGSHSGACVEVAKEFARSNGRDENTKGQIEYFENNCSLRFKINTCCDKRELANDIDENCGGLWTNEIGCGWTPFDGKVLKIMRPDGTYST